MSRLAAWRRWQAAAGPWRGYAVCPLLQLGVTHPTRSPATVAVEVSPAAQPAGASAWPSPLAALQDLFAREPTAVLVDLDPLLGVIFAAHVSRLGLARVVLVLPRWPHADAVLPFGELAATLHTTSQWLATDLKAPHVVFVLDGERRKTIARPRGDPRIDNRYEVSPADLPSLRTLRAAGIRRVVKLAHPS